jgi:uncharacterized protein (TIGR02678 family)
MSNLANQLVIAEREEVARAIRLLLATPLIGAGTAPEAFDLVRRRREPVEKWFDYYCGWSLIVEPRLGYARLAKVRVAIDPTRPARRHRTGRAPFDRRRYTLLCVVAAELLGVPVTTVGLLADRVVQASAVDPVLPPFDTSSRAERMAFVDALRLLESVGAVEVVDGATESFVDSADAKVLYRVDATLLMRVLAAPVGASQVAVPAYEVPLRFTELLIRLSRERRYGDADEPVSEVQRNLWLRHSVFRKLVDDPVVHRDDLTPAELAYLESPTGGQLLRRAADQAGLLVEERAEGIMLIDPDGVATDSRFPDDSGNAKIAALLLGRFPKWAKGYRGEDGATRLVADALDVLREFGLVRLDSGVVRARPAATRYAVTRTSADDVEDES